MSLLNAVNFSILAIDAFAFEFVLVLGLANVADVSKVASLFVCKELENAVLVINVNFTLMDKINTLQHNIKVADVICVVVDILES